MSLSDWNQWDSCHSEPGQEERRTRATHKKLQPASIDFENHCATFKGSGLEHYETNLFSCTCIDFRRRSLPCKHMYRLAHELHIYDLGAPVSSPTVPLLDKKQAMDLVQSSLTVDEQKFFRDFCYECGNDNAGQSAIDLPVARKFIDCGLAVEVTDVKILLSYMRMQDIRKNFLPPELKSPRTKAELIDLVAPLVSKEEINFEDALCITLHPQVAHLGHTLHRHLCSIYPREQVIWYGY